MSSWIRSLIRYLARHRQDPASPGLLGLDATWHPDETDADVWRERLATLPAAMQRVYRLRVVDHLSTDEISRRLAVPRPEVERILRGAIVRLANGSE
jgi:DNA-directed RNA polymerase specialized sigma24 family protein